ncbi:MarR family winged helix-turn-helix transcriptional regulator [Chitinophaga flava]|uniref:MarR family transcriptional regulator n=1 Tax=Chitinophaga flava TaxID=2259036 RepID=A0A365Y1K4_9BACT|nr:MarR family transcriptional regulator [Chitinophaga flava]RBL92178.1 MarR family transcriptional regulator [Chitinophaga flava]
MKSTDNTFSAKHADDSSGFLLWQVTSLWQREIKKALEQYDLTHSQFVLMASIHWLTLNKQDVTQIMLSSHTKIDPMTTSTVLRTLQVKGFVQRREHSTDTRAKTVYLTEEGKKIIKKAVVTVENFDKTFFSKLGDHVTGFNSQLRKLLTEEA